MKQRLRIEKLANWVRGQSGRQGRLAAALGVATPYLSQMIHGDRPVRVDLCARIEAFTCGEVLRQDCRPLDGDSIWPPTKDAPHA